MEYSLAKSMALILKASTKISKWSGCSGASFLAVGRKHTQYAKTATKKTKFSTIRQATKEGS